ncbi:MAG: hypothetical protein P8R01_13355 [Gammaproteobacteria bacterium]|nr:hypothetical protein [Gammaproteobacteria bacterium]
MSKVQKLDASGNTSGTGGDKCRKHFHCTQSVMQRLSHIHVVLFDHIYIEHRLETGRISMYSGHSDHC